MNGLDFKKIAIKIIEARRERGWTQIELAVRSKVHRTMIIRYESIDNKKIRIENLVSIAEALNKPLSYFLDEDREIIQGSIAESAIKENPKEMKKVVIRIHPDGGIEVVNPNTDVSVVMQYTDDKKVSIPSAISPRKNLISKKSLMSFLPLAGIALSSMVLRNR